MLWANNGILSPCCEARCYRVVRSPGEPAGFDRLLHQTRVGAAWVMWTASEWKTVLLRIDCEMGKGSEPLHTWDVCRMCTVFLSNVVLLLADLLQSSSTGALQGARTFPRMCCLVSIVIQLQDTYSTKSIVTCLQHPVANTFHDSVNMFCLNANI